MKANAVNPTKRYIDSVNSKDIDRLLSEKN